MSKEQVRHVGIIVLTEIYSARLTKYTKQRSKLCNAPEKKASRPSHCKEGRAIILVVKSGFVPGEMKK